MESNNFAKELLNWSKEEKKLLKVTESDTPISGYYLNDLKIALRMREDDLFLKNDILYSKIRRGNCIAVIEKDKNKCYKIARKGIIKFFDYPSKFNNQNVKKRILSPIEKAYKDGHKVKVYITEKANGENCQISYESLYDAWIVGSKNVTILVRNMSDFLYYKNNSNNPERYSYSLEFAELWLTLVENIRNKGLYEKFIEDINGYTLCGENVGDLNHQHIKFYENRSIDFFGMVQNNSNDICLPISEVREILNKYNLSVVNYETSPILQNIEDLQNYMKEYYIKVLNSPVETNGEGCVVYFSTFTDDYEKIISIGKLKTFEYRFLRKIREKIRNNLNKSKYYSVIMQEVEKESKDILAEDGDDIDLTEYLNLGEFIIRINFSIKNSKLIDLYAQFIDFIKPLYKIRGTFNNVTNEDLLKLISIIGGEIKTNSINTDSMIIDNDNDNDEKDIIQRKKKNFVHSNTELLKIGHNYLIIVIGLAASGKSTIYKYINEIVNKEYPDKVDLKYISSDIIKREIMDIIMSKEKVDFSTAHDKANKSSKNKFEEKMMNHINSTNDDKINLIFLDKNFPINETKRLIEKFPSVKFLILYPELYEDKLNSLRLPFSYSYVIQSYYRLKNRKDHETLDYEKNEKCHYILFSFLSLFENQDINFTSDNVIGYPLSITDEEIELDLPKEFTNNFKKMHQFISKNKFDFKKINKKDDLVQEIIDYIEENYPIEIFSDTRKKIYEQLETLFKNKIL